MSLQNNGTFGANESTSGVNNEVFGRRVQNGRYIRPRPFLSLRRRGLMRVTRRNARRERVQNGNTSNLTIDDNDDFHFFMSLLPYLQDVPRYIRLRIRDQVQRVIIQQLEQYNNTDNDLNNLNLPSPSPLNYRPTTSQEEMQEVEEVQDPIQIPLPVYPYMPNYNHVQGNVDTFVAHRLPERSEYSFTEQQAIPFYPRQKIYQPVPYLAGQLPLPAFGGQQPLPAFDGQQPLPAFGGQQFSSAFSRQQFSPSFVGQQQHNMPYFGRQQ